MIFYILEAKDLTKLGGPMGSEVVTTIWRRYFTHVENAKKIAETFYGKPIEWHERFGHPTLRAHSGDLIYIAFEIHEGVIEDKQ